MSECFKTFYRFSLLALAFGLGEVLDTNVAELDAGAVTAEADVAVFIEKTRGVLVVNGVFVSATVSTDIVSLAGFTDIPIEDDLTIYGDGSQTRSFCCVTDLVAGLVAMMHTPHRVTGPINLGNPGEFTVRELAETIIRITGSKSKIVYKPLPQDDPARRKPDISLARELLGWMPGISLEDGLRQTIDYFRHLKDF